MLVAGVQLSSRPGEVEYNLQRAEDLVKTAAGQGARLICLSEYFSTGSFTLEAKAENRRLAEPLEGRTILRLCKLARALGVGLIVPFYEHVESGDLYFNAVAVIGGEGRVLGTYRKQHIPRSGAFEHYYFSPGDLGSPVFRFGELTFGILVCYDRHFFELPRLLALKGAQTIFVPAGICAKIGRGFLWPYELVCAAVNNGVYVVGVNNCGLLTDGRQFTGGSLAIDPEGTTLSRLDTEEGFVLADLHTERVEYAKDRLMTAGGFRPEILAELMDLYRTLPTSGADSDESH